MSQFIYIYRCPESNRREAMSTPEKRQAVMQKWSNWMRSLSEGGHIKEAGLPLDYDGKVVGAGGKIISDGPYAEAKDLVCGYTVVEAADLNEASRLSGGCPIIDSGGVVEVRPAIELNL